MRCRSVVFGTTDDNRTSGSDRCALRQEWIAQKKSAA
jgi:hypothetical protein